MASSNYRVEVVVKEVRGYCALGYRPGDGFTIEKSILRVAVGNQYAFTH